MLTARSSTLAAARSRACAAASSAARASVSARSASSCLAHCPAAAAAPSALAASNEAGSTGSGAALLATAAAAAAAAAAVSASYEPAARGVGMAAEESASCKVPRGRLGRRRWPSRPRPRAPRPSPPQPPELPVHDGRAPAMPSGQPTQKCPQPGQRFGHLQVSNGGGSLGGAGSRVLLRRCELRVARLCRCQPMTAGELYRRRQPHPLTPREQPSAWPRAPAAPPRRLLLPGCNCGRQARRAQQRGRPPPWLPAARARRRRGPPAGAGAHRPAASCRPGRHGAGQPARAAGAPPPRAARPGPPPACACRPAWRWRWFMAGWR